MNKLKLQLIENLAKLSFPQNEMDEIMFAFNIAHYAHLTQKRDCGKDYITHPVEGCILLAEEFDIRESFLYIAFLLHDVGEDTSLFGDRNDLSYEKFQKVCIGRVMRIFGQQVASLVVELTKPAIDGVVFKDKKAMMDFYLGQLSESYHAVLLKMIDRLHNLKSLPADNQKKIDRQITETEELLIPIFKKGIEDAALARDPIAENMKAILRAIESQLEELKK